jgi:hypothetical protein
MLLPFQVPSPVIPAKGVARSLLISRRGQPARWGSLGMAKQRRGKVFPASKAPREDDDTLLMKSAESLAKVIAALQRQLRETLPGLGARKGPNSSPSPVRHAKSAVPMRGARPNDRTPRRPNSVTSKKREAASRAAKKR